GQSRRTSPRSSSGSISREIGFSNSPSTDIWTTRTCHTTMSSTRSCTPGPMTTRPRVAGSKNCPMRYAGMWELPEATRGPERRGRLGADLPGVVLPGLARHRPPSGLAQPGARGSDEPARAGRRELALALHGRYALRADLPGPGALDEDHEPARSVIGKVSPRTVTANERIEEGGRPSCPRRA